MVVSGAPEALWVSLEGAGFREAKELASRRNLAATNGGAVAP